MAPLTIVAIGDSLTQGFQHGALNRPQWSFPSILARSLGLDIPGDHKIPDIAMGGPGYPVDIEHMLRHFAEELGDSIELREWILRLPVLLPKYLDHVESYYERGPGSRPHTDDVLYHNLAIWGFTVNEALTMTPQMCASFIKREEGLFSDDLLAIPSAPMYRAARRVLNPAGVPARDDATMLDSLRALSASEPIDLLVLWLGVNDCLGTVLEMKLEDMPSNYSGTDPFARRGFNLTSAPQFHRDYQAVVDEVAAILDTNPGRGQVYVGTIPHVTIPPVTNGIGDLRERYFDRYVRFFRNDHNYVPLVSKAFERRQAIFIDERIDQFNASIRSLTAAQGWKLVETAQMLEELAVERNGHRETPEIPLRDYLVRRGYTDHPLLALDPLPSVEAYTVVAKPGGHARTRGGLFSLDHLHPSTMGYGLAAERFLEAIKAENPDDARIQAAQVDWAEVVLNDTLEQTPPVLWDDFMDNAERFAWLWELITATMARRIL